MSAFIDLDDGRIWSAANWAYDAIIEAIARELDRTILHRELAAWLLLQTCQECGPGMGSVDVRELSPAGRFAFRDAAHKAYEKAARSGGADWQDPSFFPGWITKFRELLSLWEKIERGEPVDGSTPLSPASGGRVGPGW